MRFLWWSTDPQPRPFTGDYSVITINVTQDDNREIPTYTVKDNEYLELIAAVVDFEPLGGIATRYLNVALFRHGARALVAPAVDPAADSARHWFVFAHDLDRVNQKITGAWNSAALPDKFLCNPGDIVQFTLEGSTGAERYHEAYFTFKQWRIY